MLKVLLPMQGFDICLFSKAAMGNHINSLLLERTQKHRIVAEQAQCGASRVVPRRLRLIPVKRESRLRRIGKPLHLQGAR